MTTATQAAAATPTASQPSRQTLFAIYGAALLMRLMALWSNITTHPHTWLFSHPWEMGLLARTLLHHQGYSSPFGVPTGPTAIIAPGYPTLVAGIFAVFGVATFASALVIIGINIALGLLTIWIVMHVAGTVFGRRAALLAGWFWALSPPLWFIPEIFWETSFSAAFLVGAIALALHIRRQPSMRAWIGLGALCALMSLINPALMFSLLAILGWLAWYTRRQQSWRAPALALLMFLAVYSPWPIRNAYRFHAFIPLRSTVGFELWMGNRAGSNGRLDESVFPMFNHKELSDYIQRGEVDYIRHKNDLAWSFIHSHPGWFAQMTARRAVRFWIGTGNAESTPVFPIHAILTTGFGLTGLILAWRRGKQEFAALAVLPILLFPVSYYISHAEFRYRLNIDPLMTVLAAYAVTELAAHIVRRRQAQSSTTA